jgi:flagellar basal body rod protein FlgC
MNRIQIALAEANHALANDEAAVKDIARIVENYETKGKRPFYIYCSATGIKKGMSQTPVFEKRLALAGGDILNLFATYKAREGRPTESKAKVPASKDKVIDIEVEVLPTQVEPLALENGPEVLALEYTPEEPAAEAQVVVVEETVDPEQAKRDARNARRREQRAAKKAQQAEEVVA